MTRTSLRVPPARFRFGLPVVLLAVGGCGLDFTEPFGLEPALLSARLQVTDEDPSQIRFSAQLRPGRDRDSEPRMVVDETLEMLNRRLEPVGIRSDGTRNYAAEWTLEHPGPPPETRMGPPVVQPAAELPSDLRFGTCQRHERDERVVSPSDTIFFQISCDHSTKAPAHSQWGIRVREAESGATILALNSTSEIPETVGILAEWLQRDGDPVLEATVTVTNLLGWMGVGGDYRVNLDVIWEFSWKIRWCAPEEACAASESRPTNRPTTTATTKR